MKHGVYNVYAENKTCMTDADLVRVKQLLEQMFVGGLRFDSDGKLINGTRWDYETAIFVSIELLATVGMSSVTRPRRIGLISLVNHSIV